MDSIMYIAQLLPDLGYPNMWIMIHRVHPTPCAFTTFTGPEGVLDRTGHRRH